MQIVVAAEKGFTRTSLNVNLRSAGYRATEAEPSCLFDVLAALRGTRPHLVVLDYEIPLCNCETLVRIIREDPILFMTPIFVVLSPKDSGAGDRMSRWEHVRILWKPLKVGDLLRAVREQFPTFSIDSSDRETAV